MIFDTLCIVVTRECNSNKCVYCHVEKKEEHFTYSKESKDTLKKLLPSLKTIKLFGGEPLLQRETVFSILEDIRNIWKFKGDVVLNTNLILLEKSLQEKLIKYNVTIQYSLDGHIKTVKHNRKIDKEALELTYKNFKALIEHYPREKTICNFVIAPKSVENSFQDFLFLWNNKAKRFNLLPAMYVQWTEKELQYLDKALYHITNFSRNNNVYLQNTELNLSTPLFNNYLVWDSNNEFYPSMFILESFCKNKSDLHIDPFSFSQKDRLTFEKKVDSMIQQNINKDILDSTKKVNTLLSFYIEQLIHERNPLPTGKN